MNQYQCFKIKRGTDYDIAVKKHFSQRPKWKNVVSKVNEILCEGDISEMALVTDALWINTAQLKSEKNKNMFTKDGKLKSNSKKAKEVLNKYISIIEDEGLSDFVELGLINFSFGVMRLRGQELESFVTSEHDIYYKCDYDLKKRTQDLVIPITEIEYEEKYLEELKRDAKEV